MQCRLQSVSKWRPKCSSCVLIPICWRGDGDESTLSTVWKLSKKGWNSKYGAVRLLPYHPTIIQCSQEIQMNEVMLGFDKDVNSGLLDKTRPCLSFNSDLGLHLSQHFLFFCSSHQNDDESFVMQVHHNVVRLSLPPGDHCGIRMWRQRAATKLQWYHIHEALSGRAENFGLFFWNKSDTFQF